MNDFIVKTITVVVIVVALGFVAYIAMYMKRDGQETVSRMTGKDYGGGLAKFDAMEDRVRQKLDASSASMELASAPANEADALAAKYGSEGSDVDSELAALKAELNSNGPEN